MTFQRINRRRGGVCPLAVVAGALLLGACGQDGSIALSPVAGFAGVVAGDEPRSVAVGREVLAQGGTAVDAAVAMAFTMAVTIPSRASLGGGGVCVLFTRKAMQGEAIEFLPRAAPSGGMVPSGARAMAALHARAGALRWEQLVSPGENLARFGHPVSRAFAQDLAAGADLIAANPGLRRLFAGPDGGLATTGDRIVQTELAAVLSGIRQQGAAYMYAGRLTARLAEASSAVGLPLSAEDVRRSVPRLAPAVAVPAAKRDVAFFAPPRASGGVVAGQIWGMLSDAVDYQDADDDERDHLFAEAAMRAFARSAAWLEPDGSSREALDALVDETLTERLMADYDSARHTPASAVSPAPEEISAQAYSAGFAVGDRYSNAVACSFTMNRLFGAGRVAPDTGILLAAPPRSANDGSTWLSAVVVGNTRTGDVRFAGSAGDGPFGASVLARAMLDTLERGQSLETALRAPRVHHGAAPDVAVHEVTLGEPAREALARRGHALRMISAFGHVNAFVCPKGLKDAPESCEVASDPRGYGMSQVAR